MPSEAELQAMARRVCVAKGIDPDGHPMKSTAIDFRKNWRREAEELRRLLPLLQSLSDDEKLRFPREWAEAKMETDGRGDKGMTQSRSQQAMRSTGLQRKVSES
jgi:hypothetical protein